MLGVGLRNSFRYQAHAAAIIAPGNVAGWLVFLLAGESATMAAFADPISTPPHMPDARAPKRTTLHLYGLDGMRGVAAFIVLYLHGSQLLTLGYAPPSAGLAVDFFFLLSGFVIARAYDGRLGCRRMSWRGFMLARMIRLYPMVCVGTVLGGAVFLLENAGKIQGVPLLLSALWCVGSLLLVPVGFLVGPDADGFYPYNAYPLNNPVWSLVFEIISNALYGTRFGRLGRLSLSALVIVSGAALVITIALWPFSFNYIGFLSPLAFGLGFVRVTYPFWFGVFIQREARFYRLPRLPIGLVGLSLAVVLLLPYDGKFYYACLLLLVLPLILELAAAAHVGGFMARLCSAVGEQSYPLYLVHQPIFRALKLAGHQMPGLFAPWTIFLGGTIVSIAVTNMLLIYVDRPVRTWLSRHLEEKKQGS